MLIEQASGPRKLYIAIECKDRSSPVGVPDLEAFAKKCEFTDVNKSVMVSGSGFTNTALEKAAAFNVDCIELNEVREADWSMRPSIFHTQRIFSDVDVTANFKQPAKEGGQVRAIFDAQGRLMEFDRIKDLISAVIDQSERPHGEDGEKVPFSITIGHDWILEDMAARRIDLKEIVVDGFFETVRTPVPMTSHNYKGAGVDVRAYSAVLGPDGIHGKIILVDRAGKEFVAFWKPGKGAAN